jgi:uncharacterized CHY-type Zn-finger protein
MFERHPHINDKARCSMCFIALSEQDIKNGEVMCQDCRKVDWYKLIKDECFICGAKIKDMSLNRYAMSGNCCPYCGSVAQKVAEYRMDREHGDMLTMRRIQSLQKV